MRGTKYILTGLKLKKVCVFPVSCIEKNYGQVHVLYINNFSLDFSTQPTPQNFKSCNCFFIFFLNTV